MIDKELDKKNLVGKRILLISLPGYSDGIIKQMEDLGADVDYISDKPNEGFLCKSLGRLQIKFYQKIIDNYYQKKVVELKHNKYDYILVIRGEYTTVDSLKLLRKKYSSAKMILYMWDGLHKQNTRGIEKKWRYYDRVYTFDRFDYEENKDQIDFLPLYYYEEYLPKRKKELNVNDMKYDVSFIGTGHADRVRIVKEVMQQCKRIGKRTYSYTFMPHPILFWLNKIKNKDFKNVVWKDIHYKKMPIEKLYEIYNDSMCVVDVENPRQHGLTMRSIEIIGLKRKLITTNQDVKNYDFYEANNILIIDRNNPVVDMSFFEKPYIELDAEIYEKYSLKNWIFEVLK